MSDNTIQLLTSIFTLLAVLIGYWRSGQKLDHITISTNSTLSEARDRITALEALVKTLVEEKIKLTGK